MTFDSSLFCLLLLLIAAELSLARLEGPKGDKSKLSSVKLLESLRLNHFEASPEVASISRVGLQTYAQSGNLLISPCYAGSSLDFVAFVPVNHCIINEGQPLTSYQFWAYDQANAKIWIVYGFNSLADCESALGDDSTWASNLIMEYVNGTDIGSECGSNSYSYSYVPAGFVDLMLSSVLEEGATVSMNYAVGSCDDGDRLGFYAFIPDACFTDDDNLFVLYAPPFPSFYSVRSSGEMIAYVTSSSGVDASNVCNNAPSGVVKFVDDVGVSLTQVDLADTSCFPFDPLFYGVGFNASFILPPSSSSSNAVCFAGSETVTLEGGAIVPIASIRVGDRVLAADASGKLSFSDVIAVPHSPNNIVATFVELATASGKSIRMTPAHLVLVGACDESSPFNLKRATDVVVGSCLRTVNGLEAVLSTSFIKSTGIYTIVTMEEMVVVNGIVSSPFAVSHTVGNTFYGAYKWLYSIAPYVLMSKTFVFVHQSFSAVIMSL